MTKPYVFTFQKHLFTGEYLPFVWLTLSSILRFSPEIFHRIVVMTPIDSLEILPEFSHLSFVLTKDQLLLLWVTLTNRDTCEIFYIISYTLFTPLFTLLKYTKNTNVSRTERVGGGRKKKRKKIQFGQKWGRSNWQSLLFRPAIIVSNSSLN